uniref:Ig-like domain-containing protein n=1 Tax=Oncorhynchus kisutch TaxID=8019 RepID=A0A8C7KDB0_ONCKI
IPHKLCSLHLCCCCWQLSMVVKPGESLSITCKVSGYSISDDSYTTDWIRHPVDKAMEWIGDSDGNCKDSLKSRFSISKDDSNNIVILEGQRIGSEDTAVYYCHCDAFDYWGKGTQVTVSAATAPPTLLTLMNCGTPSNDIYSLGCIAKGFSPSSHTFKWTDASGKALTDFIQYPAVQSGETYTGVSQLRVAKNVWGNSKSFSCSVDHPGGAKTAVINRPKPLTVTLNPPSVKEVFLDNQAVLDCVISGTDQDTVSGTNITWQVNGQAKTRGIIMKPIESKGNLNSRVSTLTIDQTEWTNVNKVQCSAMKRGEDTPVIQDISEAPSVSVHLLPEEDTKKEGEVTLVCLVVCPSLCDVYIMWQVNSSQYQEGVTSPPQKTKKGNYFVTSVFTTAKDKWDTNVLFTCAVKHAGLDNSTSPKEMSPEAGFALSCTDNFEDEFSSLWSTTSSFIILFLLSLTYSTVLSLVKVLTQLINCDCRLLMKAIGSSNVMIVNKIKYVSSV